MQNVRWHHECARIKRFDHDYVVVMGGTGQTSNFVNVIEFYDLTTKPASWETIPGRNDAGIIHSFNVRLTHCSTF